MCQQAEGLRQAPSGEGVRAEPTVYECQTAREVGIRQVGEVLPQLQTAEHTLVDDGLAGEGAYVEVGEGRVSHLCLTHFCHSALNALADEIEHSLENIETVVRNPSDEHLPDGWFDIEGGLSQTFRTGGHGAQVHQRESFALYFFYHHLQHAAHGSLVFGQEHESRAVFSFLGHGNALQQNKFVGYLEHDARAVARLVVSTFSAAVAHVLQHGQGVLHQFMTFVAVDVQHHAHAASIVLVCGIVESVHIRLVFVCVSPLRERPDFAGRSLYI